MAETAKSSGGLVVALLLVGSGLALTACCFGGGFAGWLGAPNASKDAAASRDLDKIVKDGPANDKPSDANALFDVTPPAAVTFDHSGVLTIQTTLDADDPDPIAPERLCRQFPFRAWADTVYVVECWPPECGLRIEPPGDGPPLEAKDHGNGCRELAFVAESATSYVAVVNGDAVATVEPFTLTIRRWDESVPLPAHLKLAAPPLVLPKMAAVQPLKDRLLVGGAFAPDGKSFWTAHHDMTLTLWQSAGFDRKGTYKLKKRLYALAVDGKGKLYAQPGPADTGTPLLAQRGVADIEVYSNLHPKGDADELPRPTGTILMRGMVGRMIASKDGRWIYFLDVHNGKLGRIDTYRGVVNGSIDELSEGTRAFCLTHDGKRIYCCADTGYIDVINAASFAVEQSVALNRGRPFEIAATDKGVVFLLGQGFGETGNCALVDLSHGLPSKAVVMPVACAHHGQFLQVPPEQDVVFIAGDRRVTACAIPARPAVYEAQCRELRLGDALLPGWMQLGPDGRTILHDSGTILSVSR